ncbi:shikimate kinase [Natrarchaeobaculum sulfurireducens]|uniref:Shikimate kinase n=1 Tax=Natrarchaeobaculum sulfurireducens TaxID=2044521 RepID=A0A346PDD8_9EURY|nr:shikimate kinase [Natrarchaeobaculum sulfurireducens]AXR77533.1 Archaeal shikimate kinase [Natrarchaeobaculum sulfurireducens]AXR82524.1 Shikimate kinase II [Natrarchaeobaculum sulfurireducens]
MDGRAVAPAAGTVLNALATGVGSAFAIDLETTATVELTDDGEVTGEVTGQPDADTTLVERCVEFTIDEYAELAGLEPATVGAQIQTESEVPMASGLKSSSAAANATVLATLDALEVVDSVDRIDACRLGVRAARDAGVTVTGAFDDASASMLGGITVTDNATDELLARDERDWYALVYTPPEQSFSADADVSACERIAPMADLVEELALEGRYGEAMTVNGFAFAGALGFSTAPMLEVMPDVEGVSLSGTGPSYVAVGEEETLEAVRNRWADRDGTTRLLRTRTDGTRTTNTP